MYASSRQQLYLIPLTVARSRYNNSHQQDSLMMREAIDSMLHSEGATDSDKSRAEQLQEVLDDEVYWSNRRG